MGGEAEGGVGALKPCNKPPCFSVALEQPMLSRLGV
jgi:hypothetical protein